MFRMPEGTELAIRVYLIGMVAETETEICLTMSGLTVFSDEVRATLDLPAIIKAYHLDDLGDSWRLMTREEIKGYREREKEEE